MTSCPFTSSSLEQLLRGHLPDSEREDLVQHLAQDCPECERRFAELDGLSRELVVKFFLARQSRSEDGPALGPEAKARIFRAIAAEVPSCAHLPAGSAIKPSRRRALSLAAGLALAVTLTILGYRLAPSGPKEKGGTVLKGTGISLQFLVVGPGSDPAQPEIKRGDNQVSLGSDASLLFRYTLEHPSRVYLVRVGPADQAEVIYPPEGDEREAAPGVYDAAVGNTLFAYPLKGLDSPQTFCALTYASRPADRASVARRAAARVEQGREQLRFNRLHEDWLDCFQIKVGDPWHTGTENGP